MSYLDHLSSNNNANPEENNKFQNNVPWKSSNTNKPNIPCGRGPMGSYLDAVTGGTNIEDSNDHNEECYSGKEEKKPSGWSNKYLSDFSSPLKKSDNSKDDSRTDIRNLLTQRSIQSFMYLLEQCRDPHSAKFIQEDFLQTGNLLDYHGTGAGFIEKFGGMWHNALISMIQHPKHTMIVSAKRRGRGHGGWSTNNPYLEERWVEIPITINPANLCERILTVREQIAKEWIVDLDILIEANNQILDSYFDTIRSKTTFDAPALSSSDVAFERTAVNLINDKSRFDKQASSPFRRTNFDLLYNLCTQASIHRILRNYIAKSNTNDIQFNFLKSFYVDRAFDYFDGEVKFGAADDFIDELLQTSPSISTKKGSYCGDILIDPLGTAEEIIRMRNVVANEWKELMREVENDHIGVRRAVLSKQYMSIEDGGNFINNDGEDSDKFLAFQ